MIALPQDKTNIKAAPINLDTEKQYSDLAKDYVWGQQYKKEQQDKRDKEFIDYSNLTPQQLIGAKLQNGQTQEMNQLIDSWTKMHMADKNGENRVKNLMTIKLQKAAFENKQSKWIQAMSAADAAHKTVTTDFDGKYDKEYFQQQYEKLVKGDWDGEAPTDFLKYAAMPVEHNIHEVLGKDATPGQYPMPKETRMINGEQRDVEVTTKFTKEQTMKAIADDVIRLPQKATTAINDMQPYWSQELSSDNKDGKDSKDIKLDDIGGISLSDLRSQAVKAGYNGRGGEAAYYEALKHYKDLMGREEKIVPSPRKEGSTANKSLGEVNSYYGDEPMKMLPVPKTISIPKGTDGVTGTGEPYKIKPSDRVKVVAQGPNWTRLEVQRKSYSYKPDEKDEKLSGMLQNNEIKDPEGEITSYIVKKDNNLISGGVITDFKKAKELAESKDATHIDVVWKDKSPNSRIELSGMETRPEQVDISNKKIGDGGYDIKKDTPKKDSSSTKQIEGTKAQLDEAAKGKNMTPEAYKKFLEKQGYKIVVK